MSQAAEGAASKEAKAAAKRAKKREKKKQRRSASKKRIKTDNAAPVVAAAEEKAEIEKPAFEHMDDDDHCETPILAYQHVASFLDVVAGSLGKTRASLRIYDPYYCAGGIKQRLGELGFENVLNENVDCYLNWDSVEYDVLVTNPPYSGDHMEKMVQYLAAKKKPFAFVVPNFVIKKPYHREMLEKSLMPMYLVPKARYVYLPPKGFREKKASDTQKKSSPYVTIWHLYGGSSREWRDLLFRNSSDQFDICRSRNAVRDLRRKK